MKSWFHNIIFLRTIISVAMLAIILVRLIWPNLKLDSVTLGLVVVGVLPWLSWLIESAKLPGGWEIKLRDLQKDAAKVLPNVNVTAEGGLNLGGEGKASHRDIGSFLPSDSNIALVELRIEIEKRLRELVRRAGLNPNILSLRGMLDRLASQLLFDMSELKGLQALIEAGNRAAHGAFVEGDVAMWAARIGPQILQSLDQKIDQIGEPPQPNGGTP